MATNPTHVTSFAELHERLESNPVKARRDFHLRRRNSWRSGERCDHCGGSSWIVTHITAECGNPRCDNVLLKEQIGNAA
ncbi:MAG: hypothetical protein ACK4SJ_11180 [Sphingorhabdus sp.]